MTPEERAARAIAVRNLLDDPNIKDAFASIEQDLTEEWKRTFDAGERDNLWRTLNIMERLQQWLRTAASHDLAALKRSR